MGGLRAGGGEAEPEDGVAARAAPGGHSAPGWGRARRLAPLAAATLLLPTLALRGIWPPDETRYAAIAAEMLRGGSWIVPHLHGSVYGEKPPVFFWAVAGLARLGVPLEAAPRLLSILAALAVLAGLPRIAARLGLGRVRGERAAWVLATTPFFLVYAQVGLLDLVFTGLVTAAIAAKLERGGRGVVGRALAIGSEGLALGAALLVKGPVALLFPLGLRVGAAVGARRARAACGLSPARADTGDLAVLALALAGPGLWLAAAAREAGFGYVEAIALGQAARRIAGAAPHLRPPGFLLLVSALGTLPWSALALRRIPRAALAARGSVLEGWTAVIGWLALPLVLLALLPSQQPHYALPAFPAAALGLARLAEEPPSKAARAVLKGSGCVLGLALLLAAVGAGRLASVAVGWGPEVERGIRVLAAPALRVALASGGAILLGLSVAHPLLRVAGSTPIRVGAGGVVFFVLLAAAMRWADPWILPRAVLTHPAVVAAPRVAASGSLRTALEVVAGRSDAEPLAVGQLRRRLASDPGLVALVWQRDLDRIGWTIERDPAVEVVVRAPARGRTLLALRAARREPSAVGRRPAYSAPSRKPFSR